MDQTTLTLTAGGATGTITATVLPADATNKTVTWTSSNEAVATVAGGVVTPLTAGTTTITATAGEFTATTTVTVVDPQDIQVKGNGFVNSTSYKGVFVEILLPGEDNAQIQSLKVELFNGDELIGTNTLKSTDSIGSTLTSPFVVIPGEYSSKSWTTSWVDGKLSASNAPAKAVITAVDKNGVSYTAEAAYTGDWDSVWAQDIQVKGNGFVNSTSYKGVFVEILLPGEDNAQIQSLKVELFNGDELIGTNTLKSTDSIGSTLTSPFVVIPGEYSSKSWTTSWVDGKLSASNAPAKAVITAVDKNGVSYTAEAAYTGDWDSVWAQDIQVKGNGFVNSTSYKGVFVEILLPGEDNAQIQSLKVELFNGDELIGTNTLKSTDSIGSTLTSPFVVIPGEYSSKSWTTSWVDGKLSASNAPAKAVITAVDKNGVSYTAEAAYTGDWDSVWAQDIQVKGNGFVNSTSYKGVFVEILLPGEDNAQIQSLKVELFNGDELIGTNTLKSTDSIGSTLTSPFVVIPGEYSSKSWTTSWVDGKLSASNAPAKAVITAVDKNGVSYTAEAAYTGDWDSVWAQDIQVKGNGFVNSTSYKGVFVEILLPGEDNAQIQSLKVELFNGDELIGTNTLKSTDSIGSTLTSPFVVIPGEYSSKSWTTSWVDGKLSASNAPAKAVITAVDKNGVSYTAEAAYTGDWDSVWPVAMIGTTTYSSLKDALDDVTDGDTIIELFKDARLEYGAREAYGTASTDKVTIKGNGKTLTLHQTNTDWSSIGLKNADATFAFEDVNVVKTTVGGNTAWNNHAINFSSKTELTNITFDNAIALSAGAKINGVTITEAKEYYGIWIRANGQEVTIEDTTVTANTNGGRGIKISDQYIDAPQLVKLSVSNSTFNTAKKSAIIVGSKAGAEITIDKLNIENVQADKINAVWVDEGWAEHQDKVTVTGGTKILEGAVYPKMIFSSSP